MNKERFTDLVKHTYRVLLTRGMKGCYVYFMDDNTREYFQGRIGDGKEIIYAKLNGG